MKYALAVLVVWAAVLAGIFGAELYKFSSRYEYAENSRLYSGAQIAFPFAEGRIFTQLAPHPFTFAVKNWSAVLRPLAFWRLSVGNLSVGGIFSRFNSPVFSTPAALKSFGTPQTGLFVSQPSFSSAEMKTAALVTSFRCGPLQFHVGGRVEKAAAQTRLRDFSLPFFVAAEYAFPPAGKKWRSAAALRGLVTVLAGHAVLKSREESAWFRSMPYFAPTSVHYVLAELTLKNSKVEFFTSNGWLEHPLGRPYFFTRHEIAARFGLARLNAAFSLIDCPYMGPAGSIITQGAHAYVNPQLELPLGAEGAAKLRGGFLAALEFRQDAGRTAEKTFKADFKASLAFSARFFTATGGYGIAGCSLFNRLAPLKDSVQTIQLAASYRTAPVKPQVLLEAAVKHESAPFYYGTPQSAPKSGLLVSLKGDFRLCPDLRLQTFSSTLFKKAAGEYGVSCSLAYEFFTARTASAISFDCSFKYKTASSRKEFSAGLKYVLQVRQAWLKL